MIVTGSLTSQSVSASLRLRSRDVRSEREYNGGARGQAPSNSHSDRQVRQSPLDPLHRRCRRPARCCASRERRGLRLLAHDFPGTIGRANLDGSAVNQSFVAGGSRTAGVAVDGSHLYWANYAGHSIGRSNLDGTDPEQSFITGANFPIGVAVDGSHVYWANNAGGGSIGRADLNGSNVEQNFIAAPTATGVAVDGTYIYWAENLGDKIGRAKLSGSEVDHSFITGASHPYGVAVDAGHVYWTNEENGTIGRANLNGTEVNQSFISPLPEEEEVEEEEIGGESRYGIAVDAGHIYWANDSSAEIGRANLDGSGFNPSFIFPATAFGVAVDLGSGSSPPPVATPLTPSKPSNSFGLGKLTLNKKAGSATLILVLPGPGKLVLKGKGLLTLVKRVKKKGKALLTIRPTKKTKKTLARAGKAKVTARLTFTPTGGTPHTESKTLTLKG